jgi:2-oxo-4-hydroxy-4-carboxy-5-ureidoimidazoline decarboxylase
MILPMTVDKINSLSREQFVATLGWVFEHSPWVAERAWALVPFSDLGHLHDAMRQVVSSASKEEQLMLLHAHPDLGERARMSNASSKEQSGAGLDNLSPDEYQRLKRLNAEYREKFGFPFLYAVKGNTKYDILQALEQRLRNNATEEFQQALEQVYRIALFRLQGMIAY